MMLYLGWLWRLMLAFIGSGRTSLKPTAVSDWMTWRFSQSALWRTKVSEARLCVLTLAFSLYSYPKNLLNALTAHAIRAIKGAVTLHSIQSEPSIQSVPRLGSSVISQQSENSQEEVSIKQRGRNERSSLTSLIQFVIPHMNAGLKHNNFLSTYWILVCLDWNLINKSRCAVIIHHKHLSFL